VNRENGETLHSNDTEMINSTKDNDVSHQTIQFILLFH
jgi:hypothetical protein